MAVGSSPPTEQAVKFGFGQFNDGFGEGYFVVGEARRLPRCSWDLTQLAEKVQEARDLTGQLPLPQQYRIVVKSEEQWYRVDKDKEWAEYDTLRALEAIHEPPAMPHAKRELVDSATDAFYGEAAFHGLDAIVRPSPHKDAVSLYAGPFDGGKDGHFHIHDEARRRRHGWDFHDLKKRVDNLRNRSGGTPDPRHYGYVIMDHIRHAEEWGWCP
ncbi:unnamed protein product [Vitrella brassicaformis CCMP3155]|uniref:Uncharacterized protein n=1 Tax=Vitrella brassicaformis (strain CCMP3155) TaxID=1169540 RepID=A0A0G4GIW0_VITBC|nr:unnamed protein product [Vitrella brassicaformis CCMP3155]|eukprot:CEM29677.1 unnamed protein product [Vitrella brassicaformis CCMP3155]